MGSLLHVAGQRRPPVPDLACQVGVCNGRAIFQVPAEQHPGWRNRFADQAINSETVQFSMSCTSIEHLKHPVCRLVSPTGLRSMRVAEISGANRRIVLQARSRAGARNAAVLDDLAEISNVQRSGGELLDQQHGDYPSLEPGDGGEHLLHQLRGQAHGGLIEQQHFGAVLRGARHGRTKPSVTKDLGVDNTEEQDNNGDMRQSRNSLVLFLLDRSVASVTSLDVVQLTLAISRPEGQHMADQEPEQV
jgi:hypothetical protein